MNLINLKTLSKIFLSCLISSPMITNSVALAEDSWGSISYKSKSVTKQIEENDRVLNVAHKVQCRYFSTHKENSLKNQRAAKYFNKEDIVKIDKISKDLASYIDSYCAGNERLNPTNLSGEILTSCFVQCHTNFKSTLESIGKFNTAKFDFCKDSCRDFISPISELARITIETSNILENNKKETHDCSGAVDSSRRDPLADKIERVQEKKSSINDEKAVAK